MTATSIFTHRLLAAFGAFAITSGLLLGSFGQVAQVQSVAGIVA